MVELVNVDAGTSGAGVDHERVLHKREVRRIRGCAVDRFERVGIGFGGGGCERGGGDYRRGG